jgi:hypothetical protein
MTFNQGWLIQSMNQTTFVFCLFFARLSPACNETSIVKDAQVNETKFYDPIKLPYQEILQVAQLSHSSQSKNRKDQRLSDLAHLGKRQIVISENFR